MSMCLELRGQLKLGMDLLKFSQNCHVAGSREWRLAILSSAPEKSTF